MRIGRARRRAEWSLALALGLLVAACDGAPTAPTVPTPPDAPGAPQPPEPDPAPQPQPVLGVERILTYGDSLTEGESSGLRVRLHDPSTPGISTSYPFKLQALLDARYPTQNVHVFNGGRGGERATAARDRMVALIDALDPQVMILMTGTNDLNVGLAFGPIIAAIEELIDEAADRGVVVLLATLPRQVEGGRKADAFHLIEPFNAELADVAADEGIGLIDAHPHLLPEHITPDGIHVNEAGNQRLAELVRDALVSRYEIPGGARRR